MDSQNKIDTAEESAQKSGDSGAKEKLSFMQKLKNKFRYRLSFNIIKLNDTPGGSEAAVEGSTGDGEDTGKKAKPVKQKKGKIKKDKVKKAKNKKEKPVKAKADKTGGSGGEKEKEKEKTSDKKKGMLIGLSIGGVVVAGGIVAAILVLNGSGPDYAKRLQKAEELYSGQEYEKAAEAYTDLTSVPADEIDSEITVQAYLGLSDVYDSEEKLDMVIMTLRDGIDKTGDQRLRDRLNEVDPEKDDKGQPEAPPADMPVVFFDPAFESMLRMALQKPDGQIMQSELESIKSLKIVGGTHAVANGAVNAYNTLEGYIIDGVEYKERGQIKSLRDIVNFPKLTKLVVSYNSISDITGIEEAKSLDTLGLYFNDIIGIDPISAITGIEYLYMYNNRITSLAPLSELSNIKELWVQNNSISDMSVVSGMPNLKELFISNNQITDISPVSGLQKLELFYAADNNISDISAVSGVSTLTDVSFLGNPVTDMSPASHIPYVNIVRKSNHII